MKNGTQRKRRSRQPNREIPQITEAEKMMIRKEHPTLMVDSEDTVELRKRLQQSAAKYRRLHPENTHFLSRKDN